MYNEDLISQWHYTQVKSCVTDKHNTKYNTLISEQP